MRSFVCMTPLTAWQNKHFAMFLTTCAHIYRRGGKLTFKNNLKIPRHTPSQFLYYGECVCVFTTTPFPLAKTHSTDKARQTLVKSTNLTKYNQSLQESRRSSVIRDKDISWKKIFVNNLTIQKSIFISITRNRDLQQILTSWRTQVCVSSGTLSLPI